MQTIWNMTDLLIWGINFFFSLSHVKNKVIMIPVTAFGGSQHLCPYISLLLSDAFRKYFRMLWKQGLGSCFSTQTGLISAVLLNASLFILSCLGRRKRVSELARPKFLWGHWSFSSVLHSTSRHWVCIRHDNKVGEFGWPLPPRFCSLLKRQTHTRCDELSPRNSWLPVTGSSFNTLVTISTMANPSDSLFSGLQNEDHTITYCPGCCEDEVTCTTHVMVPGV